MKFSRGQRLVFGASVAAMATSFLAAPAAAQVADVTAGNAYSLHGLVDLGAVERDAQNRRFVRAAELEPQTRPDIPTTELTPEIVIANPGTPTTARDPANVTGVG